MLTLPHCLCLKKGAERKARIYQSHHEEGSKPLWEETPGARYTLRERDCLIWLLSFSWKKFDVEDKLVDGKYIMVYV
ncbi:hypothetical protein, partial [Salmonella sp. s54395]|uniref:hypothetical protein n=1 Tax=Salmonella sp. s54395 TaxID=3159664 RepID=UPI00397E94B7